MTGTQGAWQDATVPLAELSRQFDQRIDQIARHLLGEPNRALSSRAQLRFGRNGSVAVELVGNKRGQWYDHEQKQGGSALDLVVRCTALSRLEAVAWAAETFGIDRPMQKRMYRTRFFGHKAALGGLLRGDGFGHPLPPGLGRALVAVLFQ